MTLLAYWWLRRPGFSAAGSAAPGWPGPARTASGRAGLLVRPAPDSIAAPLLLSATGLDSNREGHDAPGGAVPGARRLTRHDPEGARRLTRHDPESPGSPQGSGNVP